MGCENQIDCDEIYKLIVEALNTGGAAIGEHAYAIVEKWIPRCWDAASANLRVWIVDKHVASIHIHWRGIAWPVRLSHCWVVHFIELGWIGEGCWRIAWGSSAKSTLTVIVIVVVDMIQGVILQCVGIDNATRIVVAHA